MNEIEDYIAQFPQDVQNRLYLIKDTIEKAAPQAEWRIAWSMPTYSIGKQNIIHFSVQKNFISLHVGSDAILHFKDALEGYSVTKSVMHCTSTQEIPTALISEMVQYAISAL